LFIPLGIAYVVSILASLIVSLTVTPALCSYLLPKSKAVEVKHEGRFVQWLKRQDERLLQISLSRPKAIISSCSLLVVAAAATIPFMGREFLPPFNEGTVTISLLSPPGTSLSESNRIGTIAERQLLKIPEVSSVGRRTGRAEQDEHAEGVHSSEIDVDLKTSKRSREEILKDIRAGLMEIPGIVINIGQPISHRLDHLLSGVRAQIALKIFGPDLSLLRQFAEETRNELQGVPGLVDLQIEKMTLIPQIQVLPDHIKTRFYGLRSGDMSEQLENAFQGQNLGQVLDGNKIYPVQLRLDDKYKVDMKSMENLLIDTPLGAKVPLRDLAKVQMTTGPNSINHENGQRRIVISANTEGRDLGAVVNEVKETLASKIELPEGYFFELGGQFESQVSATRTIAILSLLSLFGVFLVLYAHFGSAMLAGQVMLNVPLALVGSVTAVYLTGGTFSVATLVGFITLCGIASRNGIMMISHYLHLMAYEGEVFGKKMIVRGSLERLIPVLMTALTAGLALIPIAMAAGEPGKEILHPVAIVIVGGLISSTLLDMAVTPAVFYKFGKAASERALKKYKQQYLEENHVDTFTE
jgi:CzcA family heavy metal efflux pump